MNAIPKTVRALEHHCLQLPYASLRLHPRCGLERLVVSIEEHGQLVPVVIVPSVPNQWVLMDGYLRLKALQRIGKDTINAEVWECDVTEALLRLLTEHQSRTLEIVEEALLLRELHTQHGLSQSSLAKRMGRDKSWVSRRLALLEYLSEPLLCAITQGKLSLWAATRIVAPLARANATHGEGVLNYLVKHPHSTRELRTFYESYQGSNHPQRLRMVNDPALFFKAQKLLVLEKEAQVLQAGPEGQWLAQLRWLTQTVGQLKNLAPTVFTAYQESHECHSLLNGLNEAQTHFNLLTEKVRSLTHEKQRPAADDSQSFRAGTQPPCHQPVA